MNTKYRTTNTYTGKQKKGNKRMRILKWIRCACAITIGISSFLILGLVGGLENDMLTIEQFLVYISITLLVLGVSIELPGRLQ